MVVLTPYKLAVKRRTIKLLMDEHGYTRSQARLAWTHVTDEHIAQCSMKCGVNLATFSISGILDWIKANWKTILQVAIALVSVILMFGDENVRTETKPEATQGHDPGDEQKKV